MHMHVNVFFLQKMMFGSFLPFFGELAVYKPQNRIKINYMLRRKFMRERIRLDTMSDINHFVADMTKCPSKVSLTDKDRNFVVSAKSMLGAVYSMEWDEIWVECDDDIYHLIRKYMVD